MNFFKSQSSTVGVVDGVVGETREEHGALVFTTFAHTVTCHIAIILFLFFFFLQRRKKMMQRFFFSSIITTDDDHSRWNSFGTRRVGFQSHNLMYYIMVGRSDYEHFSNRALSWCMRCDGKWNGIQSDEYPPQAYRRRGFLHVCASDT